MSLTITGASGQLGRRTAELLLDTDGVDPAQVVLITRSAEKLADLAARGAQIRLGDFSDPTTLSDAFEGATRVLIISTSSHGGERVAQHQAAIDAAKAAGAELIAYTSVPNPDPELNAAIVVPDHAATERAIANSGVPYTFLRNALYSDFKILEAQAAIAEGVLIFNTGEGASTYVSREDCAAAAASVLAGGPEHAGQAYTITGSELLTGTDLAALYSSLNNTQVKATSVSDDAFAASLVEQGWPEPGARAYVSFGQAIRGGAFAQLTDHVKRLTGQQPQSVRETLLATGVGQG
jgi:NAD(P)H dehydrogenase (quinone)